MLRPNGEPYKTEKSAQLAARAKGVEAEPVEVAGGWGLQEIAAEAEAVDAPTPEASPGAGLGAGPETAEIAASPETRLQRSPAPNSPEFKQWFGESKVVDEGGAPKVLYHGSRSGEGIVEQEGGPLWMTDSKGLAEQYAWDEEPNELYARMLDPLEYFSFGSENVEALPLEPAFSGEELSSVLQAVDSVFGDVDVDEDGWHYISKDQLADVAQEMGRDGLILRSIIDSPGELIRSNVYVSFSPGSVKSVGNRGTFDPNDPRVSYRRDGASPTPGLAAEPQPVRIRVAPRFGEQQAKVRKDLDRIGKETFGEGFGVELAETITAPEGTQEQGAYDPQARIAYIAMRAEEDGMTATLYHEGIHHLRNAGAFTGKEGKPNAAWQTLERQAAKWREDYNIDARYAAEGLGGNVDMMNEEAIAEALADYATRGKETGFSATVRMAFDRVLRFFRGVASGMRGQGFETWESIFEGDILSGRAGGRADAATRDQMDRQLQTPVGKFFRQNAAPDRVGEATVAGAVPAASDERLADDIATAPENLAEFLVPDASTVKTFGELDVVEQRRW